MQTQPLSSTQEATSRPSPVEIWQRLLSHLLDRHYGLTLNDTPFGNDGVIQEHIDAGITQLPRLTSIDILRARKATGLMTRNDYRTVTDITTGKYRGGHR